MSRKGRLEKIKLGAAGTGNANSREKKGKGVYSQLMAFGASFVTLFLAPGALSPHKNVPPLCKEDPIDWLVHIRRRLDWRASLPPVRSVVVEYARGAVEHLVCFLGVFQGGEKHVTKRHRLVHLAVLHGARVEADVRWGEAPTVALGDQVSEKVIVV